jgi:hypothetical protein
MGELTDSVRTHLQDRHAARGASPLAALARPAATVLAEPQLIAETTILVDEWGRARHIVVPAGRRRVDRHAPMLVQAEDDIHDVALRAMARHSEDRFSPLCLCDDLGKPSGIIPIESLLEYLARESRRI